MSTSTAIVPAEENGSYYASTGKFELMMRIAKSLSQSQLVPQVYQQSIPNCMIALDVAERSGESPFIVMQNLHIIHNKPSFSSAYLIGGINKCGRFTPLRFHFEGKDDDWSCTAWAFSKDASREPAIRSAIAACVSPADAEAKGLPVLKGTKVSIGMAKQEGWHGKAGSKWRTMPELMLQYRAATWFCRMYAPDVAMGMKSQEEVIDVDAPPEVMPDEIVRQPANKGIAGAMRNAGPVIDAETDPAPPAPAPETPPPAPTPAPAPAAEAPKAEAPKAEEKPKRTRRTAAEIAADNAAANPPAAAKPAPASNPDLEVATPPPPPAPVPAPTPAPAENPAPAPAPAKQEQAPMFDDEGPALENVRDEIIECIDRPTTTGMVMEITLAGGKVVYWRGPKTDVPGVGSMVDIAYEGKPAKSGQIRLIAHKITLVG